MYLAYGNLLIKPLILENLPKNNIYVHFLKLIYCVNLILSYPLYLCPANETIEFWLYDKRRISEK